MGNCVKCGTEITGPARLWCNECRKYVDEEFNGEIKRPYEFYFTYYIKHKGKSNVKSAEKRLRKRVIEQDVSDVLIRETKN